MKEGRWKQVGLFVLIAHTLGTGAADPAAAQESPGPGWYASLQLGLAGADGLEQTASGNRAPTRCDPHLYLGTGLSAAADADCQPVYVEGAWWSTLRLGEGLVGAAGVGYAWSRLRVELEYLGRRQGRAAANIFLKSTQDLADTGRNSQWNPVDPPATSAFDFSSHQLFVNVHYPLPSVSRWAPYLGAGGGWSRTAFHFGSRFTRKTVAQGYLDISSDVDWPEVAKRAAAGSASIMSSDISGHLFGFQLLGGAEYPLAPGVSLTVTGRWARFQGMEGERVSWAVYRSREPTEGDARFIDFADIGYWAVTTGIRVGL